MPEIVFDKLVKRFNTLTVIDNIDAVVPDKEFLVLVGPSGCGKSTMLRMIAGLAEVSSGSVRFDGKPMENVPPSERDIAFVFQSYALYPHLTVRDNIAFPLIMRKFRWWYHLPVVSTIIRRQFARDPEITARVTEVAEMLELTPYLDRKPGALSGGQRQRVAVARALVREPSVYLLDEPLSNLDAALRTQMRAEIIALYRKVQKSFIYVTHDQVEAMTMGTRIIVLDKGVVQQFATPTEIYEKPANIFVAKFIGVPPMNLITPGAREGGVMRLSGDDRVEIPIAHRDAVESRDFILGVRPEAIQLARLEAGDGAGRTTATVVSVEYMGAESIVSVRLGSASDGAQSIVQDDGSTVRARVDHRILQPGDRCTVTFDLARASYFDRATGMRIETAAVSQPT